MNVKPSYNVRLLALPLCYMRVYIYGVQRIHGRRSFPRAPAAVGSIFNYLFYSTSVLTQGLPPLPASRHEMCIQLEWTAVGMHTIGVDSGGKTG